MALIRYLCLQVSIEGQASYAHVHEIINGLIKRGWTVELFEPSHARTGYSPGMAGRLLGFICAQARLLFRQRRSDILYIRAHFAALPTALAARLLHIPVVQEVNGPYEDLFIAWPWTRKFASLFKWMIRTQLRWADAVIVVTPGLKDWIIKEIGERPVYIIPNGANTEIFKPTAVLKYPIKRPYAVFFGALAPWQGIDVLIRATERTEWPKELQLVVVGDGAERPRVKAAVRCNNRIVFIGKIPYQDIAGIIAKSMVGLSPQTNVGNRAATGLFPLKVFETMACGVPVIVTDYPGQAELVKEHDCGIVIPPDDPKALAQAVAYLYANPDVAIAMGQRARRTVENNHSWDKRAEDTEKILRLFLKKSNSFFTR